MTVEVNTREYRFEHGKMPRGRGLWGFELRGFDRPGHVEHNIIGQRPIRPIARP